MSRTRLSVAVMVVAISALPHLALAAPLVVDFDALSDGETVAGQFAGLTFSNATAVTAGLSLNEFEFPPSSGSNVVFDDGGPIRIDFSSPTTSVGGFFTYTVPLTLSAFDASDNLLGSVSSSYSSNLALSGDLGSLPNEWLVLSALNISYVVVSADLLGGSFTLDDLTYEAASIPEPAVVALLLLGGIETLRRGRQHSGSLNR